MRKSSTQYHNNPILVPLNKSTNPVRYINTGHIFDLKTRVDIWLIMNVVSVGYVTLAHMFHFIIWFFHYVTDISFRCNGVQW